MFSRLVGNDRIKQTLKHLLSNGRVPNSMIFAGDDGIGKRQFAIELARAFTCVEPVNGAACGVCPACIRSGDFVFPAQDDKDAHKRVIFSSHPDVGTVIPYNRNILVDAIRHLESESNFRPYEARDRFFIVDDADKMNEAASNALLKTLEEPAPTSHIFLVTSRPDALLPTIRSRCQTLRFAPVSEEEIERYLIDERAFTSDEARLGAKLSRGSIARAIGLNVQEFRERRDRMLAVVTAAVETGDVAAMLRVSEVIADAKNKDLFDEDLDVLQSLIHDIWTVRVASVADRIVNTDVAMRIERLAAVADADKLAGWLKDVDDLRDNLLVNLNRRVATDALFVSMAGQS